MGKAFKTVQGITLFSPAKVNLFFKVLGRRSDGYHEVASLNQVIDLGDVITLERSVQDTFTCSDPEIPLDHTNLVLKALALFREKTALNFPVSIHLEKKIPIQAGLGGGSSNAATTLFGLQLLSGLDLKEKTLQEWGSFLGADVPFFFSEGTAYCTGRGECIENIDSLMSLQRLWIAKPQEGLSTPAVYSHVQIRAEGHDATQALEHAKLGRLVSFNDLEEAAFSLLPSLNSYRQQLLELGFSKVVMTGSGSAFMCFGEPILQPVKKCEKCRKDALNLSQAKQTMCTHMVDGDGSQIQWQADVGRFTFFDRLQYKIDRDFVLYPVSYCRRKKGKWYER